MATLDESCPEYLSDFTEPPEIPAHEYERDGQYAAWLHRREQAPGGIRGALRGGRSRPLRRSIRPRPRAWSRDGA